MYRTPLLKARISKALPVVLLLFGAGLLFLCGFFISLAMEEKYPNLGTLLVAGLLGLGGLLCFRGIFRTDNILIFSDRAEIISITGFTRKIIPLKDIVSWIETAKKNQYGSWFELLLYTRDSKYKINSHYYRDYEPLRDALTRDIPGEKKVSNGHLSKKEKKIVSNVLVLFCILFLYLAYHNYQEKDRVVLPSELSRIKGTISHDPVIHEGRRGRSKSVRIMLKEYPDFDFGLSGVSYAATFAEIFVNNVHAGDSLMLDIKTDEYQMKISGEKPMGFWDKTGDYDQIEVYGLSDKEYIYLSPENYNSTNNAFMTRYAWLLSILGFATFLIALVFALLSRLDRN